VQRSSSTYSATPIAASHLEVAICAGWRRCDARPAADQAPNGGKRSPWLQNLHVVRAHGTDGVQTRVEASRPRLYALRAAAPTASNRRVRHYPNRFESFKATRATCQGCLRTEPKGLADRAARGVIALPCKSQCPRAAVPWPAHALRCIFGILGFLPYGRVGRLSFRGRPQVPDQSQGPEPRNPPGAALQYAEQ